ncbi:hypothetical protein FHT80_005796 [Rhizobium sp. BK226]|uniref:hypothetical protein n=1 Tax=Rhizobium sp. BK226 TaxID=2587075 RepID=UPI001619D618|nr:hypothetical protein [Rhizobium sp. BK226]MBB4116422.1 hypothetical protein [Rhizobium sp. BK226]
MNSFQHYSEFLRFVEALQKEYPQVGTGSFQRFTLTIVLRQLGLACLVGGEGSELAAPPSEILSSLDKALRGAPSKRQHLCPLNLAADLPALSFGPNQVRTFSPRELDELFDINGLRRAHPSWSVDSRRFSEFTWLIVEEDVVHKTTAPGQRRLPSLFGNHDRDFGQIEPYHTGLPAPVEDALFGLLTIPWEKIVQYDDMDWRGFQIPWVYTIDSDVFARRVPVPSPDSLAWEPASNYDASGNEYEYERPIAYPLEMGSDEVISLVNDTTWNDILTARQTSLFGRPIAHFFVRGFQASGIDEFLAHISTIEAALGQPEDHVRGSRKKINGKDLGATQRVVRRISGLLNDQSLGQIYLKLFGLRSDFLHGKRMANISGVDRSSARALARKTVCALIGLAASEPLVNRETLLDALLDRGEQLK